MGWRTEHFEVCYFETATAESQMTRHRKICEIGLRGYIHNYLCLVIFLNWNLEREEYDNDVNRLVAFQKGCVCAAKQSTFMGLNSLFLRYCTRSDHRILSSILTYVITLRHEKCTKPSENY